MHAVEAMAEPAATLTEVGSWTIDEALPVRPVPPTLAEEVQQEMDRRMVRLLSQLSD